jgi:hypothetical protein
LIINIPLKEFPPPKIGVAVPDVIPKELPVPVLLF